MGWDWASLQLNDGREIMAYRMRRENGSTDPYSTLAWIDQESQVHHFGPDQFTWTPTDTWTSPDTGAAYPLPVRLTTEDPQDGTTTEFLIEPLMQAQEQTGDLGGIAYWEGACRVRDKAGNMVGRAYMELTGYAGNFSARFR